MGKIVMVSVLEGEHSKDFAAFLESEGYKKKRDTSIKVSDTNYEVVAGYLAHIRSPRSNTGGGKAYVHKLPDFMALDYMNSMENNGLVYFPGKAEGWRKTVHFLGDEDTLPKKLKDLTEKFKEEFGPWDCVRDLEYALTHWNS
ncbi:hypothetical protein KY312_00655 [Candidatus Woesearchaeota archaeon]|nr:hypothetical protein [Candidatus Woesearchaeota archaeon]